MNPGRGLLGPSCSPLNPGSTDAHSGSQPRRRLGLLLLLAVASVQSALAANWPREDLFPTLTGQVQGAYLTYYARSGDPAGLDFWIGRLGAADSTLDGIIAAFSSSAEFDARYGGLDDAAIIDMIYWQLFNRAADAAGKAYYLERLSTGESGIDRIALDILYGAQGPDEAVLVNKITVADFFTQRLIATGTRFDDETVDENIALLAAVDAGAPSVLRGQEATDVYMVGFGAPTATFQRIATFPAYLNLAASEDPNSETVAEISTVSSDGNTIVYTDAAMGRIGFVDITDAANPLPAGFLDLGGEPTSVAVKDQYVLAGVNTSVSFTDPSGYLAVVDLTDVANPVIVTTIALGGQPDSVAVSPDGLYAAVAIENERDEDLGDGGLPQLPAGYLSVITMVGDPDLWLRTDVDLTGLADVEGSDPEPEYVAINQQNQIAVTLQENNHMVLVDAATAGVTGHFPLGSVTLTDIDAVENDLIDPIYSLDDLAREPDAVAWLFDDVLATANEGDWLGGSRGFTLFGTDGSVLFDSGNTFEHTAIRAGHYPEFRAENKGAEPEGIAAGRYGDQRFLFVGSERGNFVEVLRADDDRSLESVQLLAGGSGPEGLLTVPSRGLFVVSSENDDAGDGIRSLITLFRLTDVPAEYPGIRSVGSPPIAWGALSGLVADATDAALLYAVHDSFYQPARFYRLDVSAHPALITEEIPLIKDGVPVNYDLEGIAQRADGSFWLASEGGSARENLLVNAAADGTVLAEIELPAAITAGRTNSGFEGVAVIGAGEDELVVLAIQREWADDPAGFVKIALYRPASMAWDFLYYPLDAPAAAGGWVGLSEVTLLPDGDLLVLERDNQQGPRAEVKRLYRISLTETSDQGLTYPVLTKTLDMDLLPELAASNGWIPDKVEGVALAADGALYVVSDNDGLDDAMGETFFLRLGNLAPAP